MELIGKSPNDSEMKQRDIALAPCGYSMSDGIAMARLGRPTSRRLFPFCNYT